MPETKMTPAQTMTTPEQIKARCEWLIERRQGDTPIWTSDTMYAIVADYLRLLDEMARLRTGIH
jgi:hypothetical protein